MGWAPRLGSEMGCALTLVWAALELVWDLLRAAWELVWGSDSEE